MKWERQKHACLWEVMFFRGEFRSWYSRQDRGSLETRDFGRVCIRKRSLDSFAGS